MKSPNEKPTPQPKKPYKKPALRRYGSIRSLTENVGSMTLADGGTNPKIKTT